MGNGVNLLDLKKIKFKLQLRMKKIFKFISLPLTFKLFLPLCLFISTSTFARIQKQNQIQTQITCGKKVETPDVPLVNQVGDVLNNYNVPLADESYRGSCATKDFINHSLEVKTANLSVSEEVFSNTICDFSKSYSFQPRVCRASCFDKETDPKAPQTPAPISSLEMTIRRSLCANSEVAENFISQNPRNESYIQAAPIYKAIAHKMAMELADFQKGGTKYEALMKRMNEEGAKFQKKMLCPNGSHSSIALAGKDPEYSILNSSKNLFQSKNSQEVQNIKQNDVQDKINDFKVKVVQDRLEEMKFCSEPFFSTGIKKIIGSYGLPDKSAIQLNDFKQDNAWTLSGSSVASIINQIQNDPMMKENLNCGRIPHFEVYASSNEKANTGEAAKKFGKWGFDKLSAARADEIKNQVISKIFLKDNSGKIVFNGADAKDLQDKVTTNLGYKNTGVDGPCPYLSKVDANGKLEIKPDPAYDPKSALADKAKIEKIEKAKSVQVTLRFEGTSTCVANTKYNTEENTAYDREANVHTCFQVKFHCNESN